jgi:hypothetical protein
MDYKTLMRQELTSVEEVFEALGGTTAMARLTGTRVTTASNWKRLYGRFPARTYTQITNELAKQGKTAPASLWGMVERTEDSAA